MLTVDERIALLRTISFFGDCPDDVLADVAAIAEEHHIANGQTIIVEGDLETTMYIIVDGQVRVHSQERTIVDLGPREVIGELAALDPAPRSATVTTLQPTHLLSIRHETLMQVMVDHFAVAQGVIRFLCRRFRQSGRRETPHQLLVARALRSLD